MKVVFCIDDNPKYLWLLTVAVRSLRAIHGADAPCLCVYAGNKAEVFDVMERESIPLARYQPRLRRELLPPDKVHSIGCFLKLELALVPELAQDEAVLYCDVDVMFRKPLDKLVGGPIPSYMAMAREFTAPFYHDHPSLSYELNGQSYTVPMPFPIWTFSSGVVLFNLERLRKNALIDHFLAFSLQNVDKIGNLDQSLLNYYFGKRIKHLEDCWNMPPYRAECLDMAHIVHFHGSKPWDTKSKCFADLRINHFPAMRSQWFDFLTPEERDAVSQFA